ncbi:uncharacterized protein A1O9_04433 [Exophiala aquamarina CBS 119918]|uniref:Transcription factor domain-containing protein n=1 Tax=Exophiala aquamarina CBS 119918 TaxID=1182545 RepID=A0A072PIK7_9EURO|nr:uncharacterized protein A1O9_04433 [Exophiala aquamarina CBS 119918]KEF59587.1 hypothetical protein A1O9_04433 [Exophiala aquamarina CBS 119918]
MSEWLTSRVPPKLAFHYLDEIDEECEKLPISQDVCIDRGPFGVFRLIKRSSDHCTEPHLDLGAQQDLPQSLELPFYDETFATQGNEQLSPTTQALIHAVFGEAVLTPSTEYWDLLPDTSRVTEICDTQSMDGLPDFAIPLKSAETYQFSNFAYNLQPKPFVSPDPNASVMAVSSAVPANAVFLLSHYSTTVINMLTPFRHTKTPWHILFIPHVKSCLAAIAMGEQLDHASYCTFYGTLALSAFSMSGIARYDSWLEEGKVYKERARQHVRMMLSTAYNIPKSAKYKCILMALITMVQLSLFSRNRDQTECYFLEAEKFIRLRGLHRRKSRKVRLLHHCYVFERLFYESTSVAKANSNQRTHLLKAVVSSGIVAYGQDSPSFRLPGFRDLEQEMQRIKEQEEGENDLHLERIGDFPKTLYPEVFGVPEPYMLLLSLVIRLAREKDGSEELITKPASSLKDFMTQAKAVERSILHMHPATYAAAIAHNLKTHDNQEVIENMLTAIQHALAIYFYRRVYDLDSALLQQRVMAVRDCLLRCENSDPHAVYGSAGFIWPAFIAACEADDEAVQASFSNIFRKVAERSGFSAFADTLTDIKQIWLRRNTQSIVNVP